MAELVRRDAMIGTAQVLRPSMNQVHDIGARFGDGPVCKAVDPQPVFSEDW